MKFPKFFLRTNIPIIGADKQCIGKIPSRVARELIKSNHARIVRNHPPVIGLEHTKSKRPPPERTVAKNPLKNIISAACLFIPGKSYKRILNTILFQTVNKRLCITATDLESCFTGYLELENLFTFACDGADAICINADSLKKILFRCDKINHLTISGGNKPGLQIDSFFIEGTPADEFPEIPLPNGKQYACAIDDIAKKLAFVSLALSSSRYNGPFSGIYFDGKHGQMVCTDGNRLHMAPLGGKGNLGASVIVPPTLLKVAKFLNGYVTFAEHKDNNEIQTDSIFGLNIPGCAHATVRYRSIEGRFPDYSEVIPKDFASAFKANTKELLRILINAQMAAKINNDLESVICEFRDDLLKVTLKHHDTIVYYGMVKGEYTGHNYLGQMNIHYIADSIKDMPCDSVEIGLQKMATEGWVIRCAGYVAMIMPMDTGSKN
ncbi:MAG: hypothetical protein E3K37_03280 [Candidatus Kuenenia sp.]|nr:hypothetical protein [Candidatus Kuenenia hertensis]